MDLNPSSSRIREQEERVAVAGAVVLGLVLIFLLFAWLSPQILSSGVSGWLATFREQSAPAAKDSVAPVPAPLPLASESLEATQASPPALELAARAAAAKVLRLEAENADLQSRISGLEERVAGAVPVAEVQLLEKEIVSLKGVVEQVNTAAKRSETRADQVAVDLTKARSDLEAVRKDRDRLASAEPALKKQLEQQSAAVKTARADQARLQAQVDQLRAAGATQMDPNAKKAVEDLKARLASVERERDTAVTELERVVLQGGKPGSMSTSVTETAPDLQRTREQLTAAQERIRQLEEKLAAQPGVRSEVRTDVFRKASDWDALPSEAKRPGDLWIGAMPLFQSLQQSTTARETVQVRDAYVQANRLGTLVARIYFGDGDAQPDSKADAAMRKAMEAVAPGSYLLAVGYASVKGNAIYNENLSSLRAQTVVSRVRPLIDGGKVQMVYFGETTQFDSRDLSKNRVVELWRIDN